MKWLKGEADDFRNFGLIRDVETLKCRMAPLFDSGSCLWADVIKLNFENRGYKTKPFRTVPEKQLALIQDWEWFDIDKLDHKSFIGFIESTLLSDTFSIPSTRVRLFAVLSATISKGPRSPQRLMSVTRGNSVRMVRFGCFWVLLVASCRKTRRSCREKQPSARFCRGFVNAGFIPIL